MYNRTAAIVTVLAMIALVAVVAYAVAQAPAP